MNILIAIIAVGWRIFAAGADGANPATAQYNDELTIPAAVWYKEGKVESLVIATNGAILLWDRTLLENDSPGAGKVLSGESGNAPATVDAASWIQKRFYIPAPAPAWCRLAIEAVAAPQAPLTVSLNGGAIELLPPANVAGEKPRYRFRPPAEGRFYGWSSGRVGWFYCDLPAAGLTSGWNTVVLQGSTTQAWRIARADYRQYQKGSANSVSAFPWTSAIMSNAPGGAWQTIEGEWGIRMALGRHVPEGALESPVVDLADMSGKTPVKYTAVVREATLTMETEQPEGACLELEMRSGDSPFYRASLWSAWQHVVAGERCASRRYAQWRVIFRSADGARSPRVTGFRVAVETTPAPVAWSSAIRVLKFDNPPMIAGPPEYLYEDYTLPELRRLRKDWELDACVAGAKTDFEIMRALMHWAYLIPMKDFTADNWPLPDLSWNAFDYLILDRTAEGAIRMNTYKTRRRDLFCMTSNLVLMQALLAFGIPARYMTINGHEVCEAWSNELRKWIYLDATRDFYYADRATGTPLHILEVMRLSQQAPERLEMVAAPNFYTLESSGAEMITRDMEGFRMMFRNNFLAQRFPVPLNPGYNVPWPWNGYLNWEIPEQPVFHAARTSGRERDFYWTLNQVQLVMECGFEPGSVQVWADTETPGLARLLASVDDGEWKSIPDNWTWPLHRGENRLRVCAENSMGRRGPESTAIIAWQ